MNRYTIRGRPVQVDSLRTLVHFTAGAEGRSEAGDYYFWTAYGEDEYGGWTICGRARTELSPTDRFTRMEREMILVDGLDRREYQILWRRLLTVRGVRASSYREVANWARSHATDAVYIRYPVLVRGKKCGNLEPV